ncbi:cytochrome c-type biogenesis protein CycH [Iodidimonas gelatinilytica]|uniref:Cytochrome c-type biogenesis protein CycH n=1 Tax=Iodidimonas gelatinilytica TaxID=1236966 RepID=A0A5A7MZV0_9PROT|nr:c-type cytochrome biogenesis protein CcmI [Iodidimonas gelatinilytica]GER00965.1 cytochrome c-type biogenesis protein CycH [Iodidimonas gelatinilytica]
MTLFVFLGMAACALALTAFALFRTPRSGDRKAGDLAIYRQQLSELEADQNRALIGAEEARAARIEIERRILALDSPKYSESTRQSASHPFAILMGVAVLLALSYPLYRHLGAPGTKSAPAPSATAIAQSATADGGPDIATLLDQLEARLKDQPDRLDGWVLLGRTAFRADQPQRAVRAYTQAVRLAPDDAELQARLGEALISVAEGRITPAADLAFARALNRDPQNATAHYYVGLGLLQNDRPREALARWSDLLANSPDDAPWRADLSARVARLEAVLEQRQSLARQGEQSGLPALDAASIDAASQMSEDERTAMITGMVDRLAAKLEARPNDFEGWLQLAKAYMVLGDEESARNALDRARSIAPPDRLEEIDRHLNTLSR